MIPTPKFSVGEDVLIYSSTHPEIQGYETTVVSKKYDTAIAGGVFVTGWGYDVNPNPSPKGRVWCETALRRRPSDYSFKSLIKELNKPYSNQEMDRTKRKRKKIKITEIA